MRNRMVSSAAPALVILILSFFLLLPLAASPAAAQTELRDIAITSDGTRLYFPEVKDNFSSGQIGSLDTTTPQLLSPVGSLANVLYSMAVSPDGSRLYVGDYGAVDIIDPAAGKRLATVKLNAGQWPVSMATSPDGKRLYVAITDPDPFSDDPNDPQGGLTIIDTTTGKPLTTLGLGRMTQFVAASSDGSRIYAIGCDCAEGYDTLPSTLWVIDAKTLAVNWIHALSLDWLIDGVALSPDGKRLYLTAGPFNSPPTVPLNPIGTGPDPSVLVYDTTTNQIAAIVKTGQWAYQPLISPDGKRLYLTMMNSPDTIREFLTDPLGSWKSLALPLNPARDATHPLAFTPDAISPDGKRLYVVNTQGDTIWVIDTDTLRVKATIQR